MSTVFRVVKNCNYTTLSNYHFKDRRLSWKAKGLLSTMLSLPDDWNYSIEGLACLSNDGIKATNSGLIELEKYGYLTRNQKRNQNGHFGVTEYVIYEQPLEKPESAPEESVPDTDYNYHSQPLCQNGQTAENRAFSPYVQKRKTEKRFAEKGVQLNTNILNTKELNTSSSPPPEPEEEEEKERLCRNLKTNAPGCSCGIVDAVLKELHKRDVKFIRLMEAGAFEQVCLAIQDKQKQEPIRMLPNLINTYLDNIMLGIKAASGSENGGRDSPLSLGMGKQRNLFNQFKQHNYDFASLEQDLLSN